MDRRVDINNIVDVGIGEMVIEKAPKVLRTILGSCIGVALYDSITKTGALIHIMLPRDKSLDGKADVKKPTKYADPGIYLMIDRLKEMGIPSNRLVATIAGGGRMFDFLLKTELGKIGDDNVNMAKKILKEFNIPIIKEEIGGNKGRKIMFDLENGNVEVVVLN